MAVLFSAIFGSAKKIVCGRVCDGYCSGALRWNTLYVCDLESILFLLDYNTIPIQMYTRIQLKMPDAQHNIKFQNIIEIINYMLAKIIIIMFSSGAIIDILGLVVVAVLAIGSHREE